MFPRIIRETTSFEYMPINLFSQVSWISHFHSFFSFFLQNFINKFILYFFLFLHSLFFQQFSFAVYDSFFFFFFWLSPPFLPTISPQIYCNKTIWLHSFLEHHRKWFWERTAKIIGSNGWLAVMYQERK